MEEFCLDVRFVYNISIEKLIEAWKGLNLQDVQYIIVQFFMCFISFEQAHSNDLFSAECFQYLSDTVHVTQQIYN